MTFVPDAPNNVDHTDQDSVRGRVLSNGIDANGRMIGFIYRGADRGDHRTDQLVAQRRLPGLPSEPGGLRRLDIPTRGLAIHARPPGDVRKPAPSSHQRSTSRTSITSTSRNAIVSDLRARNQDMKIEQPPPTDRRHDTPGGPITGRTVVP